MTRIGPKSKDDIQVCVCRCGSVIAGCSQPECYEDTDWEIEKSEQIKKGRSVEWRSRGTWVLEKCKCIADLQSLPAPQIPIDWDGLIYWCEALLSYGRIRPVKGVVYVQGTHSEVLDRVENWLWKYRNHQPQLQSPVKVIDWDELKKEFILWDNEGHSNASQRQILDWFKEHLPAFQSTDLKSVKELTEDEIREWMKSTSTPKGIKHGTDLVETTIKILQSFQSHILNR